MDDIKLKSGREIYANCGILGLAIEGDFDVCEASGYNNPVSHGYDGDVRWPVPDWQDPNPEYDLTVDDMREIADRMISRWIEFRKFLDTKESQSK